MLTTTLKKLIIQFYARRFYGHNSFPEINIEYYCNAKNYKEIKENVQKRKGHCDIEKVLNTYNSLNEISKSTEAHSKLKELLRQELLKIPNKTHPDVLNYKEEPIIVKNINNKRDFGSYKPLEFSEITRYLNLIRTDRLGYTCGNKSYYFLEELAELEEALIKYSVTKLLKNGFKLISVPDILPSHVIEKCGMSINSDRTQVCICFNIAKGEFLLFYSKYKIIMAN